MMFVDQIREGQSVVGSDGEAVGTVESLAGQLLRLRGPADPGEGPHHFLDLAFVGGVDGDRIRLLIPAREAMERWSSESD
jgi:hypothetical protein